MLCASCNKARIVGERPVVVKERKPIAQVSAKRNAALVDRRKAYKSISLRVKCCEACGIQNDLTPSHVLTQKKFPQHAANPKNIVILCISCHHSWEHDKLGFRKDYPEVWQRKMDIMQALEPAYLEQLKLKYSL